MIKGVADKHIFRRVSLAPVTPSVGAAHERYHA